jgi:glycosyltransferase involved in cell wall biosynthesis
METLVLSSGINPEKVVRIPIGIDCETFRPSNEASRHAARAKLDLPQDAIVIGSFQKDGVGWEDGLEPKLIKGPDIFLETIEEIRKQVPNLWVLLSGPSRGFVKQGLEKLGIHYRHRYEGKYSDIASLYDAIDLYLITSREEGGPKACLESMAKGVPLVTTEVGQCADLVKAGVNAMMVPIGDVQALTRESLGILSNPELGRSLAKAGIATAQENDYVAQRPLWKNYFKALVDG